MSEAPSAEPLPLAPSPPLPRRLHLELTNRCNSRCETCVRTAAPESDCDMDPRDAERIAAGLPDLERVALHVIGEPLLYPFLPRVLETLARRGIFVELCTNGLALHGRRAAWLLRSGLGQLAVSIDSATAPTYEAVRGVGSFQRVVSNLAEFLSRRGGPEHGPRVALWMTAARHNLRELPALVDLAASVGADEVFVRRLVSFGEGRARPEDSVHGRLGPQDRETLAVAAQRAARLGIDLCASGGRDPAAMLTATGDPEPWRACPRPWRSAVVMTNGDLVPCCTCAFVAPRAAIRMGNLLESDWTTVWNGEPLRRHRAALVAGPPPSFCSRCGVDWSL